MLYPRFTKVIIDYLMSKDQSISIRNKMFWHTARDDTMFTSMRCVSRHEKTQVYGAILPQHLTNQEMLESIAYRTYYVYAIREKTLKEKYVRKKAESNTSPKKKTALPSKGSWLCKQQKDTGTKLKELVVRLVVPDLVRQDEEEELNKLMKTVFSLIRENVNTPDYELMMKKKLKEGMIRIRKDEMNKTKRMISVSSIPGIVDNYIASKMKETVDSTMKAIIKEQVQAKVSKIMPKIKKHVIESLEAEVLKDLYKVLVESYNSEKDIISSYGDVVTLKNGRMIKSRMRPPSAANQIVGRREGDQATKLSPSIEPNIRKSKSTCSSKDKLTNLNLEERYALNVALQMFTRRIVIQERVEDLQFGVKSYQKKINLTKPNTYRSYLRRMTPYTAYPDIQGIIYKDEMNRNRLMRTYELHKFSNGTLNHVRTALNDIDRGRDCDGYLP
ncbi:hypothetical protein Tco_0838123 [Tanacetum coccineum]|uniref:Uncharacterized protein n=1 Tax=Tanacetum coccineum TaxID=301880 RepID=A0ABQ5AQS9_9ASTR